MKRRALLSATAAAGLLAAPGVRAQTNRAQTNRAQTNRAQTNRAKTLRVVPLTSLFSLDTVFNTSLVTTNHGFAVYDTLFGVNSKGQISPQMAEGHTVSDDGRTYTIRLRDGLRFHNGEPVRAQDCVASLKRWAGRETFGQTVAQFVDAWGVQDDRTIKITLTRPVPIFLEAIGRGSASVPFIAPEYVARTDPFKQITDPTGSGPWKFNAGEFAAGSFASYTRNADYVPRQEAPDWSSGGKVVHFERMEWPTIPDPATASAALTAGEVDWYEQVQPDLVPQMRSNPDLVVGSANPAGFNGVLRFNHLHPPFNNPAIRRAVLMAVNQHDYMQALVGDDPGSRNCQAMFPCGTPYGQEIGGPFMLNDLDKARAALKAAGYNNEKVVIISPADVPTIAPMGDVTHDTLTKLGMNVELMSVDWATLTTKRAIREPVEKGGWSIFHTWAASTILGTPVEHFPMRGLGEKGWAGWYADDKMEAMTREWTVATTPAEQQRIAAEIHARAFEMVPFILCGQFQIRTAYRKYLTGVVSGGAAYMWGVRRV